MHSLVQALTLTVWLHFLIHCTNNRFFKLIVRALRTDLSEFQGQNFKVGGTLGAELVCFYIQAFLKVNIIIIIIMDKFHYVKEIN